ncbi:MAG: hypothetical protein ABI618_13745 [Nitrospirota bacterium]
MRIRQQSFPVHDDLIAQGQSPGLPANPKFISPPVLAALQKVKT